jgi:hypothetical protein
MPAAFFFLEGIPMRIKLPENFGGLSYEGEAVELEPDADGCVDAPDGIAQALLSHGGTIAPDPEEHNAELEVQLEAHDKARDTLQLNRQKGGGKGGR